jgi:hypothetical protein
MDGLAKSEEIWYRNLAGFLEPSRLLKFFPVKGMSLDEQLNAILRFACYLTLLLIILGNSSRVLFIPIVIAGGTYAMHVSSTSSRPAAANSAANSVKSPRNYSSDSNSDSNLQHPKQHPKNQHNKDDACTIPTRNNPFMNVLQSDYTSRPQRGPACDIQDQETLTRAEALFGSGVVRDSDDIFHRRTSSRAFVTNPSTTIPNDQTAFARWLYGSEPTCKTRDRSRCQYRT